jgi:acyl-coenzyme A thioesterase PaaI-like protein
MDTHALSLQERAAPDGICFCCGPAHPSGLHLRSHWDETGEIVVARHTPRPEFTGFPGLVYGGLLAMLVDCHSGWTAMGWHYRAEGRDPDTAPAIHCVTGNLNIDYLKPTPMGVELTLKAWVEGPLSRKARVRCEVWADGVMTARSDNVFVRADTARLKAQAHGHMAPQGSDH